MDGMRYRFFMSPPLNPSSSTVARQVDQAATLSETEVSRGVSAQTLVLYRCFGGVEGPKYELHSTEWAVQ